MRPFYWLLALFFLFLDLVPCNDNAQACGHVMVKQIEKDEHHEPWQDQCPPMCSCSCCNMHIVFMQQSVFFVDTGVPVMIPRDWVKDKPVGRPGSIWLPPKITS